ncbi:hypothetical protein DPMN_109065 [Dreissena polymorpha]|uniref:Uncharacterized protein n=1 Tax=Dreissena polymorpha TaxID=45954 RepID=A0A9D4KAE7_DREPO|nr:hypothetical protein DPMN_109065 [Dreissena polymorpha]
MCPANTPVIVREYSIAVYPKVLDNLNAIGKAALEDLHPWILCTLIDWERFDRVICYMPGSTTEVPTVKTRKQDRDGDVLEESHRDNQKQFVWPKGTVLKLIDLHQHYEVQFKKPGIKKKSVWCKISADINTEKEVQKRRQNRKDAVVELMNEMRADFREEQKQLLSSLAQQHEDRMNNEKS